MMPRSLSSAHYPRSAQALDEVAAARARPLSAEKPREQRLVIAGLVLAQLLVVSLYLIVSGHVEEMQRKRLAEQAQAREQHRCGMLALRNEREQCRTALLMLIAQH